MYTIKKEFSFSASHQLKKLPEGHPCKRLHGHNYIVEIILQANRLNSFDFVVDFGELKKFKDYIDNSLDHRHLNDVLPISPTAENLAYYLFKWAKNEWKETVGIRVSETPKTWAEYRHEI